VTGYVAAVDLVTGQRSRLTRQDSEDRDIDWITGLLDQALTSGSSVPLRPRPGEPLRLHAEAWGKSVVVTVGLIANPGVIPLVTYGICRKGSGAGRLWAQMLEAMAAAQLPSSPGLTTPPQAPWIARIGWPTILDHPDHAAVASGMAPPLAWAWVES